MEKLVNSKKIIEEDCSSMITIKCIKNSDYLINYPFGSSMNKYYISRKVLIEKIEKIEQYGCYVSFFTTYSVLVCHYVKLKRKWKLKK
jgi:hypothetical protein